MHNYASGLGGKHLWPVLLEFINDFKSMGLAKVDAQYILYHIGVMAVYLTFEFARAKALPPWRGLNHFNEVVKVTFSDANKLEDILKVLITSLNFESQLIVQRIDFNFCVP